MNPTLNRVGLTSILAIVASTTGGCDSPQDVRQDQAGSAHVAVLSVGRWTNYRDALTPTFKLTADQALAAAVPNTSDLEEKALEATSASLKLALPTGGTPGDASKITFAQGPASGQSAKDLGPAVSVLASPTAIDPFLRYGAATALLQEVALLDAYLKDAATDPAYEPYVVRLQVTLLPKHRDAPYDAYSLISFFNGQLPFMEGPQSPVRSGVTVSEAKDAAIAALTARMMHASQASNATEQAIESIKKISTDLSLSEASAAIAKAVLQAHEPGLPSPAASDSGVRVVPLIVTDDVEMASHSSATERIRQFALAMSAVIHGIGASAELQNVDQNLRTLLGHDFNSDFTIARASDNAIRVRFGAPSQVNQKYSMVPQTHNVTVMLLVPKSAIPNSDGGYLHLMAKTVFTRTDDGTDLLGRDPAVLLDGVRQIMGRYDPTLDATTIDQARADALIGAVDANDHERFRFAVRAIPAFADPRGSRGQYDSMWTDLIALRSGGQYNFQDFHIPAKRTAKIFDHQNPTLVDDGTSSTIVTLFGNTDLDAEKIWGTLTATPKKAAKDEAGEEAASQEEPVEVRLAAVSVKASADGRQLIMTFPSLTKLKLHTKRSYSVSVFGEEIGNITGMKCAPVILPAAIKPDSKVFAGAKFIDADAGGHGTIELVFAIAPDESLSFTVDGADVADPQNTPPIIQRQQRTTTNNVEKVAETGWDVKTDGVVVLSLSNLAPTVPVTIQAKAKKKGASEATPLPSIVLPVDRREHRELPVPPPSK